MANNAVRTICLSHFTSRQTVPSVPSKRQGKKEASAMTKEGKIKVITVEIHRWTKTGKVKLPIVKMKIGPATTAWEILRAAGVNPHEFLLETTNNGHFYEPTAHPYGEVKTGERLHGVQRFDGGM